MKRNSIHKAKKREITLMTVLANEATNKSQAILQKYNQSKAQSYQELEMKLAELYFKPKMDKVLLEKELAEIHPHKEWMIRTLELGTKPDLEKYELKTVKNSPGKKITTECIDEKCEDDNCAIHGSEKTSSFTGSQQSNSQSLRSNIEIIGLVGVVGLLGLTFIIVSKNLK